jgi:ATP-binding cassette, subfamily C, bacterial CydD
VRPFDPRLTREVPAARRYLAACGFLAIVSAVAIVVQAVAIGRGVTAGFLEHRVDSASLVALAVASLVRGLAGWAFESGGVYAAGRTLSTLRLRLLRAVVRGRPGGLGALRPGDVVGAALDGADALEPYFARFLPQLALGVVVPPVLLAWVFWHDLTSGFVLLLTVPLIPIFGILIGRATERATMGRVRALATLSTHFLDVVHGLPTLRAYRRSRAQVETIARYTDDYRRATMATLRIAFLSAFALELAASLGTAVVAVELGIRLVDGGIGLAPALTILVLAPELYAPLRNASAQFHASADGLAATTRIFELIDLEPPAPVSVVPVPLDGTLRLDDVAVAYPGRGPVLAGVDLVLERGEKVAILGPSGAGKSTMLNLVLRFLEPTTGRVQFAGVDLAETDPDEWRSRLAWVPQRPVLVAGHLSAGERRRAAIERALGRDAPIMLLDEPTAHLDAASAKAVIDTLGELQQTMLVVTHDARLAGVVDRVLELRGGRVREVVV